MTPVLVSGPYQFHVLFVEGLPVPELRFPVERVKDVYGNDSVCAPQPNAAGPIVYRHTGQRNLFGDPIYHYQDQSITVEQIEAERMAQGWKLIESRHMPKFSNAELYEMNRVVAKAYRKMIAEARTVGIADEPIGIPYWIKKTEPDEPIIVSGQES